VHINRKELGTQILVTVIMAVCSLLWVRGGELEELATHIWLPSANNCTEHGYSGRKTGILGVNGATGQEPIADCDKEE